MSRPPEDRIYCKDSMCDGDHTFYGEVCQEPESEPTPRAVALIDFEGRLIYFDLWCTVEGVGVHTFHTHIAALEMARGRNRLAGRKVKRVAVKNGHFRVVDVTEFVNETEVPC